MIFLDHKALIESGCDDPDWVLEVVASSMLDYSADKISFPPKTVQKIDLEHGNRINCLPAANFARGVAGVKWVSVFPSNPVQRQRQNLTAVILLSDTETGMPLAVLDGTLCSNMRTAAVSTIAAQNLAVEAPRRLVIFGAGEQSVMNLIFLVHAFPSLESCYVVTRTTQTAAKFVSKMSQIFPQLEIAAAGEDTAQRAKAADIIITATSSQGPCLKADWLKEGVFYSHIGGWEDEFEVALRCDKIVCDDWQHVKHGSQTLAQMFARGLLSDQDIYADLPELVTGRKAGRSHPAERVYFNAIGLSYADITLAHAMYERAVAQGHGQHLHIEENF